MMLRRLEMLSTELRLQDSRSELTSASPRTLTNPHLESTSTMARQHDLDSDCETRDVEEVEDLPEVVETDTTREIATMKTGIATERGRGTMKTDTEMTGIERIDIARTGTETLTEAMTDLHHPETTMREIEDMIEDTPAVVETGMEDIPAPPAEDLLLLDLLHAEITEVHFVHGGENYTHYFDK